MSDDATGGVAMQGPSPTGMKRGGGRLFYNFGGEVVLQFFVVEDRHASVRTAKTLR